jgi:hypothetical protein
MFTSSQERIPLWFANIPPLYGPETRIMTPAKKYSHEHITTLSNRAVAYLECISKLYDMHIASYKEKTIIDIPKSFSTIPKAVVLVAAGHGAIGVKAAVSHADIKAGAIVWWFGILRANEREILNRDPTQWLMPSRIP